MAGPDGSHTFDTKAEAWLVEGRRLIAADAWTRPAVRKRAATECTKEDANTFAPYAQAWLRDRDLKPTTRQHYQHLLADYLSPTFGAMSLRDLIPATVRTWHAGLGKDKPTGGRLSRTGEAVRLAAQDRAGSLSLAGHGLGHAHGLTVGLADVDVVQHPVQGG